MRHRLAQAVVERGGWYEGRRWLTPDERAEAEQRWAARSYQYRTDDNLQCGGCRFFAATGADYGICANAASPQDGRVTFEHGGCAEFSDGRDAKKCRRCRATKPVLDFYPAKNTGDGIDYYCKECRLADNKRRRSGNQAYERLRWARRAATARLQWGPHGSRHVSARKNCHICIELGRVPQ